MKRISVTNQSSTGRNIAFRDNVTGAKMTRTQFVSKIENNQYKNYHIRVIKNTKTPCSNPDNSKRNNLG